MMRTLLCVAAAVCLAFSAVSSAASLTLSDNFDADQDYLTSGVTGTVWDAFVYNDGANATQNTEVTTAAATGGVFVLDTTNSQWEWGDDDGPLLYINVAGGSDFVATVEIAGYTYVDYHTVGIMARSTVAADVDWVASQYFNAFGVGAAIRSTDGGNSSTTSTLNDTTAAGYAINFLKLEKAGATFTASYSQDGGATFVSSNSVVRTDLESVDLQVGIFQALFSGNTSAVSFDNFSITADASAFPTKVSASGPSPADGETLVALDTQLSWQPPLTFTPSGYDVWFGSEPNTLNVNYDMEKIVDKLNVTSADPTTHSTITALANETEYFWYVDSYEPNSVTLVDDLRPGALWSFTTAPADALVTKDPVAKTVAAGTSVSLSITALNADTYTWYRSADAIADAGDTVVGTGNPLSVTINGVAEEGWYYCVASNLATSDTSGLAQVLTERLVGYWPLDGDLTDAVDTVVAGAPTHDGTSVDPNFTTGLYGQACQFFGDGEVVTIDDSAAFFNFYPRGMTVSCWATGSNLAIWDTLVSKEYERELGYQVGKGWWLGSSEFDTGVFGIRPAEYAGGAINPAVWSYLVGVYDPDADAVRLYVNGRFIGQSSSVPTSASNLAPLIFGAESTDGTVGPSSATLDDVKIYSYALDSVEIAQTYVDQMGGYICVGGNPVADLTGDCQVNLQDLAVVAQNWLASNRVE